MKKMVGGIQLWYPLTLILRHMPLRLILIPLLYSLSFRLIHPPTPRPPLPLLHLPFTTIFVFSSYLSPYLSPFLTTLPLPLPFPPFLLSLISSFPRSWIVIAAVVLVIIIVVVVVVVVVKKRGGKSPFGSSNSYAMY